MEPMFMNPPGIMNLPAGLIILVFAGIMMFIGFMIIQNIVKIEV
jgi:Flp pilus assembly protein TadB